MTRHYDDTPFTIMQNRLWSIMHPTEKKVVYVYDDERREKIRAGLVDCMNIEVKSLSEMNFGGSRITTMASDEVRA